MMMIMMMVLIKGYKIQKGRRKINDDSFLLLLFERIQKLILISVVFFIVSSVISDFLSFLPFCFFS
jgi:hypothetical protein